jgi:eukaryotic-like serine/threonine-protein kinase
MGAESPVKHERWRQVEELFHAALERAPEERQAFLQKACGEDTELRYQVEHLISIDQHAGSHLERPVIEEVTATLDAALPLEGAQVGPYRILSPLGAGGMGMVYRARDTKLGRDVAIKTLPSEFARDPERLARLRREARTLASLNHPNIAAIYGLVESGDSEWLVLELVEGQNLRGPLPIPEALRVAKQIAEALEAAHEKGIVHRDLKPANVRVTSQGGVKVLDFGLAKAVRVEDQRQVGQNQDASQLPTETIVETLAGRIMGTPGYMSPEQARGRDVDKRTDIWAFGCVLYELLTGERAFRGDTQAETLAAVLEREPDWQALPPNIPVKIRDLLRHCLQKDPERRLSNIAGARRIIERMQRGRSRWQVAAIAAGAAAVIASGTALWLGVPARPPDRSQWVQITNLPDSASQPALSGDGRMLAFVRGPDTFVGPGQIYVKILPDGEPVELTHDNLHKMSPVFSPDGTRIAYTARDPQFHWDTWEVPVLGGVPGPLLTNASGLIWTDPGRVLFSEIKEGIHMGLVAAEENRFGARDVYLPANERGMAHRSYLSPDHKSVLLVEMDKDGLWAPCRVVPFDASSPGRPVGPPGAGCTDGAWSRDGKFVYFTTKAGGSNHIWRQRFPDGQPEQVTFGPTEEEGVAMAPAGHSFITAMVLQSRSIWVHDVDGERQVSLEGIAGFPQFTLDGKKLSYKVQKSGSANEGGTLRDPGEVWVTDLVSGRSGPVAPGMQALNYDMSADGKLAVMEVVDGERKSRLWLTPLDRSSPPRQIPGIEGRMPKFGNSGDIFFRHAEGTSGFVYRVRPDGTGLRKALDRPVLILFAVSPDERWILGWASNSDSDNGKSVNQAIPLDGSPSIPLSTMGWAWARDGRSMSIFGAPIPGNRAYIVPLSPGQAVPRLPAAGLRSEDEVAHLPGARRIDNHGVIIPGPSADVYAFSRATTLRNLYRIPIP